ncbi:MAG: permease-like cell division protein FtsX [Candidatus Falkowbacteria bacterium]
MILLSLARILKFSFQDFFRNFWLSIITVTILILSLFTINFLIIIAVVSQTAVAAVEEKVDLSLYLLADTSEEDISLLKSELSRLDVIQEVEYISRAQALESFQQQHSDDKAVLESLRELEANPLNPSLIVRAKELGDYEKIINNLDNLNNQSIIESRNFDNHKSLLESLNSIKNRAQQIGILISLIFGAITLLVVFNAIRIAIYTHKKEIGIMKLVGASNSFIRTPFLAEAVLYALVGVIGVIVIFYPFLYLLQPYLGAFFDPGSLDLITYFNSNFIKIFGIQFLLAAGINVIASSFAVSRYLKI